MAPKLWRNNIAKIKCTRKYLGVKRNTQVGNSGCYITRILVIYIGPPLVLGKCNQKIYVRLSCCFTNICFLDN
jgi:hypothetical protein